MSTTRGPKFSVSAANGIANSDEYFVAYGPNLGDVNCLVLEETPDLMGVRDFLEQFCLEGP